MSIPPVRRSSPAHITGPVRPGLSWPITSDVGVRPPRADLLAALLTVIAGAAGLAQLALSWSSVITGVGLTDASGGITGWQRYQASRALSALSLSDTATAYSIIVAAMAGAALVLLGLTMLAPLDHRPLGFAALLLSLAMMAGALWWLLRGHQTFNQSISDLFVHGGPGWYVFLIAGPVGVLGSAKALVTG